LGRLLSGSADPRRVGRRADRAVGVGPVGRVGRIGDRLAGAGADRPLEDAGEGLRFLEHRRQRVAARRGHPDGQRILPHRRAPIRIEDADVEGVAGLDLVIPPHGGQQEFLGRRVLDLEAGADRQFQCPRLLLLLGKDLAAGREQVGVGDHRERGRLLGEFACSLEGLGECVVDGVATEHLEHAVALHRGAELRGERAGEPGLRVTERQDQEPLLVAAGRPRANLDLRRLADHGQVLVLEIHLQGLAGDEVLLVAEHAELDLRRHVVLAAQEVELAFEDASSHVAREPREHLLEERGRLLQLLLVGLQERELVVGVGLQRPVGPPHELFEQLLGTVILPRHAVDLRHPQFGVTLARGAVELLGGHEPLVECTRLGVLPAGQRDVGVGHEYRGL